ncbi:protein unc-93 homolog A-like [Uloborus diversus]|uniref:protein unc-93 homolog A-like n=1 Tax=Uloborus diversus TaxID=327109 RepID=UPI00240928E5|nr:protein unc-93 homolog A-like [Uloborus diversus]
MAGGIVCQAGLLTVLWLWTPLKDDAAVFYVIAGGWGLCHAIWKTLTTTYLASTYAEDWPIPFCAYYQLQCIGSAFVFAISSYLCSEIKVCLLAAALALALVPYTALEFRIHQRSRTQTNTTAL